jgi:hypothetical protein
MKEQAIKYLAVFELEPGASLQDVKTAYQELCLIWHPDKNPSRVAERATKKIQLLNEAYQWLIQNAKILDQLVPESRSGTCPEELRRPGPNRAWWNQLDGEWKRVFRRILDIVRQPNDDELEKILTLQELDCSNTHIRNLEPLQNFTNLQKLECYKTQIRSLLPLQHLKTLREVDCWSTQINTLAPLQNLTNLQSLNCNETHIRSLESLQNLVNLQRLSCTGTHIRSLEPLQNLVNLQNLSCGETPIQSLEPLQRLTNLQIVYCSNTQIRSLAPLRNLPNLQVLYCLDTQVSLYEMGRFKTEFPHCKVYY